MDELVSIILVNYNKKKYSNFTIECIKSLVPQTYTNFEVVLIDNGSDDLLFKKLKKDISQLESLITINLIRSDRNLFFTGGNNKALKTAKGKFICILNNDTTVEPDFIQKMVNFLVKKPKVGFICPKIKTFKDKRILWYAGGSINLSNLKLVELRGQWEYDPNDNKYNSINETDFAASTSVFFKREIIEKIGMMDEIFMMYHDDPDWNLRARKTGYINYYVPITTVYHKVSRHKSRQYSLFNSYFVHRNLQILVWKHGNLKQMLYFYLKFISVNAVEFLAYISLSMLPKNLYQIFNQRLKLPFHENKKYLYAAYIRFKALVHGFKVGIKRRTNRSCKKILLEQYKFILHHQKKINRL